MEDIKIINSIKGLSIDMINKAGSGHPGVALGAAPIIYTLYLPSSDLSWAALMIDFTLSTFVVICVKTYLFELLPKPN